MFEFEGTNQSLKLLESPIIRSDLKLKRACEKGSSARTEEMRIEARRKWKQEGLEISIGTLTQRREEGASGVEI